MDIIAEALVHYGCNGFKAGEVIAVVFQDDSNTYTSTGRKIPNEYIEIISY